MISGGTPSHCSIGTAMTSPRTRMNSPVRIPSRNDVWMASMDSLSPRPPMNRAMSTFEPSDSPRNKLTSSPMTGALLPIAARASVPTNRPRTKISVVLNICCKMPMNAIGIANRNSPPDSGPCSISIEPRITIFLYIIRCIVLPSANSSSIIAPFRRPGHTCCLSCGMPGLLQHCKRYFGHDFERTYNVRAGVNWKF